MVLKREQGEGNVVLHANPAEFEFYVEISNLSEVNWAEFQDLLSATHLREVTEDESPDAFEWVGERYRQHLTPHPAVESGAEWLAHLDLSLVP